MCSLSELYALEQRFDVAKLLYDGQVYTDIMEKTHASSATISRVNKVLNYGLGGLSDILDRYSEAHAQDADKNEDQNNK
jgi:TrpR-related protein YerC/YecD